MKYKPVAKDKPYIDPRLQEDPTFINYLALAAAILDIKGKRNLSFYLNGLYDNEEAECRMNEIDKDKEMGCDTYIVNLEKQEKIRKLAKKKISSGVPAVIVNNYAGTEEKFDTLKAACEEYDLNYKSVKVYFSMQKSKEIMYQGLIIRKLK